MVKRRLYFSTAWWYPLIVLAVGGWCFLFNLGGAGLRDWDEGIYALISQETAASPSWTLHLNGAPWPEKPPLGFWLEAVSIKLFGFSESAIRWPAGLCLVASLGLIYAIASRLFNRHVGLIAAVVTLISPAFFYDHMTRTGDLEALYLLTALLSIYWLIKSKDQPFFFIWSGLAAGLCLMSRGFSALLVVAVGAIYWRLSGRWRGWPMKYYLGYAGIFLAVVLPWHIGQLLTRGQEFWRVYFAEQLFSRFTEVIQNHVGPWHYYLDYLNYANWGWQPLVWLALLYVGLRLPRRAFADWRWLWWWPIIILVFLSALVTKLRWYSIVALPALMMMATAWLAHLIKERRSWATALWAALADWWLLAVWFNQIDVFNIFKFDQTRRWRFVILAVGLALTLWLFWSWRDKKWRWRLAPLCLLLAMAIGVNLLYARRVYRIVTASPTVASQVAARVLTEQTSRGEKIGVYQTLDWYNGWWLPQAEYYLARRGGFELKRLATANQAIGGDFNFYLTSAAGFRDLQQAAAGRYQLVRLVNEPLTASERLILMKKIKNF